MHRTCTDKSGDSHDVTVVGEFSQKRLNQYIEEDCTVMDNHRVLPATLLFSKKLMTRSLTMGMSICHPTDDFDEEIGITVARRRIKDGNDIGTLYTHDVTMLTKDQIMSHIKCKLDYICEHIDEYIERLQKAKNC